MKAIQEARLLKREIEKRLATELIEFTKRTGLQVSGVRVEAIETTGMGDPYPRFDDYRVEVDIKI